MPKRTAPIVGLALLLAGVVTGCGAVSPTPGPTAAATTTSPAVTASSTPPPSSAPPPSASPDSSASRPTSSPPPSSAVWFEDHFDGPLGWVPADRLLLETAIEGGAYVLRPRRSTEPAYAWAPRDGAFGAASVEATITLPAGASALAGIAVADLDFGLRLVLLLGADGAWRLQRDDAAALRTLASGQAATSPAGVPVRLRLVLEDGVVSAWAGDQQLGRATIQVDAGHAGLAALSAADGERLVVDDFRVVLIR